MAAKLSNAARSKHLQILTDASGATYLLKPNGKKHFYLTVAITANSTTLASTVTAAAAGDTAETSHATGLNTIFVADATKWQFMTNA
jgi:hypothetical protein